MIHFIEYFGERAPIYLFSFGIISIVFMYTGFFLFLKRFEVTLNIQPRQAVGTTTVSDSIAVENTPVVPVNTAVENAVAAESTDIQGTDHAETQSHS